MQVLLIILAVAAVIALGVWAATRLVRLSDYDDADWTPVGQSGPLILTVSGILKDFQPAFQRPGCVLLLEDNGTTGKYYVAKSPHDVRRLFPIGERAVLKIASNTKPVNGVFDTLPDPG